MPEPQPRTEPHHFHGLHKNPGWARRDYAGTPDSAMSVGPDGHQDPGEAEPPEVLVAFARENRTRFNEVHADEMARRERRSLKQQLDQAHARASKRGIDVTAEMAQIARAIEQVNTRLREA